MDPWGERRAKSKNGAWANCSAVGNTANGAEPWLKPFQKAVLDGLHQKEEKQYFEKIYRLLATLARGREGFLKQNEIDK